MNSLNSTLSSNAAWGYLDPATIVRPKNNLLLDRLSALPKLNGPAPIVENDTVPSSQHCITFAPPPQRSTLKSKHCVSCPNLRKKVHFSPSVDVRHSLQIIRHDPSKIWWTVNEIKNFRLMALAKNSPLHHSAQICMSKSSQMSMQKELLSSPPPPIEGGPCNNSAPAAATATGTASQQSPSMPRVITPIVSMNRLHRQQSAQAELSSSRASAQPSPRDIRYQKLLSEIDREIYITNEERRTSTRSRLNHYCAVLDDIDRQVDEGYTEINVNELSQAGMGTSGESLNSALKKGRREAVLAKAILMAGPKPHRLSPSDGCNGINLRR